MPEPAAELPRTPGREPEWSDTWQLDAATSDGTGLTVRLELYPNQQRAWFWTYLILPTLPGPVVVRDHEVPAARRAMVVRAEGLWAELSCETPLEHWTYGLEAFGVRLDDPADALTGEIGERMPVGLDLEWEIDGPIHSRAATRPVDGYVGHGVVHGEILLGRDRLEFDGRGEHQRSWGRRDWHAEPHWSLGCAGTELALHVEGLDAHTDDQRAEGFVRGADRPLINVTRARRERDGSMSRVVLGDDLEVDVDALMAAPVPIDATTVLDRALCRFRVGETCGVGWSSVLERHVGDDVRG